MLLQKRLPFGIKWSRLTNNLPGVAVYLDETLVNGTDAEEHLNNLWCLLQQLSDKGLRCHLDKHRFAEPCVEYLGQLLSKEGIAKEPKVDTFKVYQDLRMFPLCTSEKVIVNGNPMEPSTNSGQTPKLNH